VTVSPTQPVPKLSSITFLGMVTNILLTIDNLPGFTFPLISLSVLILTKWAYPQGQVDFIREGRYSAAG